MGLFSKLKELKGEVDAVKAASGSIGTVTVPGEEKLELPAGRVRITYEQQRQKKMVTDTHKRLAQQPQIDIEVGDLDVKKVSAHQGFADDDVQRANLATVEVEQAGSYPVKTKPLRDYYSKDGLEPKVLLDPNEAA